MTPRRVAITGLGVVSPHGADPGILFAALMRGESAVRHLTLASDAGPFEIVGAAVQGEPWAGVPRANRVTSDRVGLYALAAAEAALVDAGVNPAAEDRDRFGLAVGTSLGGTNSQEAAYAEIFRRNAQRLSPFTLVKVMYNGPAAQIAMRYQLGGPNLTYSTTCSSSTVSIGEAARQIRYGVSDVMLAGGAEALFAYVSIKAWLALQVLAPERSGNPAASCRPFSRDRNGTVLGDGAAFVVLEDQARAVARGARIYAEVAGYAVANDASHLTQPSAAAQARTMRAALVDAGLAPEAIDYVNAHGTGTPLNDAAETQALKEVFGTHAHSLAVSSTKSMHGHLVGAAGALECVVTALALDRQAVPPTAHLDVPDPALDLDFVPHHGRSARVRAAMSNSFAVGGTAAALILRAAS